MSRDDAVLIDITNAALLIQSFIQGISKEAFLGDLKMQSAVFHHLVEDRLIGAPNDR